MARQPPRCPVEGHAGSHVVRHGRFGSVPRQRYRCYPPSGRPHSFSLDDDDPGAGLPAYRHSPLEIASALVAVGRGASYRRASIPLRPGEQNGQLIADWVRRFGPRVEAATRSDAWPAVVAVATWKPSAMGATIMMAAGFTDPHPARLWATRAVETCGVAEWLALFRSHDGAPTLLVVHEPSSALAAARKHWSQQPPLVLRPAERPRTSADVVGHGLPAGWAPAHDAANFLDTCRRELYRRLHARHARFRNVRQLNQVLALMRLDLNGQADPQRYVAAISESFSDGPGDGAT